MSKWFYERKCFWGNYSTKMFKKLKFKNSLHHSQTSIEVQQEKWKMKRDEIKKKNI
jgi:hypothetical protein